jgi:hypothetical protein
LQDIEELCEDDGISLYRKELADIMHDLTLSTLMLLQPNEDYILGYLPDEEDIQDREDFERQLGHAQVRERHSFEHSNLEKVYEKYLEQRKLQDNQ